MYHIVNDARAKRSADLLVAATITLTNQKPLNELSIAELQRESTVSRSTFYRLFDTPADVLAYACDQMVSEIAAAMPAPTDDNTHQSQLFFIEACMQHVDLLSALANSELTGLLRAAHRRQLSAIFENLHIDQAISEATGDYVNNILADILPSAMFVWLAHGRVEGAETVYQQIKASTQVLTALYQ